MGTKSVSAILAGWTLANSFRAASGVVTITGSDAGKKLLWIWKLAAKPTSGTGFGHWFQVPSPFAISAQAARLTTSLTVQIVFD